MRYHRFSKDSEISALRAIAVRARAGASVSGLNRPAPRVVKITRAA